MQGSPGTPLAARGGASKRARDRLDHVPRLVEKYKEAFLERRSKET